MASASYTRMKSRSGGPSIGTIMCVPKGTAWADNANEGTEAANWRISTNTTTGYSSTARFPGWFECDGRSLNAADYPMLFDVIGNTYGGNGVSSPTGYSGTFKLPDYRGKKLMGTGRVDANLGSAGGLTPNIAPDGGVGGGLFEAGSVGGQYVANVTRFAPDGSEITPGQPTGAKVQYFVTDSFATTRDQFQNTSLGNFGTGIGEYGFFAKPNFAGVGNQYVRFHALSNNQPSGTVRQYRATSLNLSDYDRLFTICIAGNDNNGGERPNNTGDSLKVRFTASGLGPSSWQTVIPSKDETSFDFQEWDAAYTAWQSIVVDIPAAWRINGVTVEWENVTIQANNEIQQPTIDAVGNLNALHDAYGIVAYGFLGGVFGGDAVDTFGIGTVRTEGWDNLFEIAEPKFVGNISFSAGNSTNGTSTRGIFGAPEHFHYVSGLSVSGGTAHLAAGAGERDEDGRVAFLQNSSGSLVSYSRSGRALKTHSHYISWGEPNAPVATYGNDNGPGSSGLVNSNVSGSGNSYENSVTLDANVTGRKINRTLDVVDDLGMSVNVSDFNMRSNSRREFDNALDVYLQSGEGINMMSQYTRLKYIIRAW